MGSAVSSEMVFATRSDELVHHTTDAVQSSLLRPLGSDSPLCLQRGHVHQSTPMRSLCEEYVALTGCQSCHSQLVHQACLKIAQPLLRSTGSSARAMPVVPL